MFIIEVIRKFIKGVIRRFVLKEKSLYMIWLENMFFLLENNWRKSLFWQENFLGSLCSSKDSKAHSHTYIFLNKDHKSFCKVEVVLE